MNKTFKVVFNKARGALMVVNEATSSVQKKGTKTVIATAVAAMIAGVSGNVNAATLVDKDSNGNPADVTIETAQDYNRIFVGNGHTITFKSGSITVDNSAATSLSAPPLSITSGNLNLGVKGQNAEDSFKLNNVKVIASDEQHWTGYITNGSASVYANSYEQSGSTQGIYVLGDNASLTMNVDTFTSTTGLTAIHTRESASAVATVNANTLTAISTVNTGWVATFQANEGSTINLNANKMVVNGPTVFNAGAFGTGSYGTINVNARESLTVTGNINGTYGDVNDKGLDAKFNIYAKLLSFTGNIDLGSLGVNEGDVKSTFSRNTYANITANTGSIIGDINIWGNQSNKDNTQDKNIVDIKMGDNSTITGDITILGQDIETQKNEVHISATGEKKDLTYEGNIKATKGGIVALHSGQYNVGTLTLDKGTLMVDGDKTVVTVSGDSVNAGMIDNQNGGNFIVDGGTFTNKGTFKNGKLTIKSGIFDNSIGKIGAFTYPNQDQNFTPYPSDFVVVSIDGGTLKTTPGVGDQRFIMVSNLDLNEGGTLELTEYSDQAAKSYTLRGAGFHLNGGTLKTISTADSLIAEAGVLVDITKGTYSVNNLTVKDQGTSVYGSQLEPSKDATVNINGGTLNVNGTLTVHNGGLVNLSNGTLAAKNLALTSNAPEAVGDATLNIKGGGLNVSETLTVSGVGKVNLSSGTLAVKNLALTGADKLVMTGGTLQTGSDQVLTKTNANVVLFNADAAKVTAKSGDASVKTGITATSGEIAFTDAGYYTVDSLEAISKALKDKGAVKASFVTAKLYKAEGQNSTLVDNVVQETENVETKQTVTDGKATIATTNTGAATITVLDSATTNTQTVKDVTLTGDVTLVGTADNQALVQNDKGVSVDKLTVDSTSTLTLGSANQEAETSGTISDLLVKGTVNVKNIAATIDKIETDGAAKINVGAADKRGALSIGEVKLHKDSIIFLDPDWSENAADNVIGNATHFEITDGNASELAGTVVVGRNSVLTYGGTVAQAEAGLNGLGMKWGKDDVSAAAYIAETVDLATTGKFLVNGLAVNGEASTYTLPAAGTMALTNGSLLMINGSAIGDQAIKGALTATEKATVSVVNATDGKFKLADTVTGVTKVITDNQFVDGSIKEGVVTTDVNEQKLAGAVASMGVQQMARRADTVIANTIADRTALTIAGEGVSLWADVGGERYEADDLDNGAQYEANMFYGAFGADVGITPNARIGAAIQYGTGDSKSDNYNIKNDIDAVSLALYGSYNVTDAAKIVGEFAWTKTSNDVTSSERLLKNDIDADVISLGVRGQHEFKVGALNIVPSLGLRVSRISTDAFNVGAVKVDVDDQTLVQIPLSVAFSADIEQGGWTMKPYAKVSFTPSFGDDEINVRGYDQSAIDTMPVQGDFGLSATNGNVTFGAALSAGFGQDGAQNYGGKVGIRYAF